MLWRGSVLLNFDMFSISQWQLFILCSMSLVTNNWTFIVFIVPHSPMAIEKKNILFNTFPSKLMLQIYNLVLNAEQKTFHSLIDSLSSQRCSKSPSASSPNLAPIPSRRVSSFLPGEEEALRRVTVAAFSSTQCPTPIDFPLDSRRLSSVHGKDTSIPISSMLHF